MFISPILTLCDPFLKSHSKFCFGLINALFPKFACFFHSGIFGFDLFLVCFQLCLESGKNGVVFWDISGDGTGHSIDGCVATHDDVP